MSSHLSRLQQLQGEISVSIPGDENGFLGRECPVAACEGYFLIKPGTGLSGKDLPCHCPYCGHRGPNNTFYTKEQIDYAKSVVMRRVEDAMYDDLKEMKFERTSRGSLGLSMSLKVTRNRHVPIRYYREKALETEVTCSRCTLEYAVYGLFAFCPDCGSHNSLHVLEMNLEFVAKQIDLAIGLSDSAFARRMLEDALENCVSAFDSFCREACRVRAAHSTAPSDCGNGSFQNLNVGAERIRRLFSVDLHAAVKRDVWDTAASGFMKRHVVAHRGGVVDKQYVDRRADPNAIVGRFVSLTPDEIKRIASSVLEIGRALIQLLPPT